MKKEIKGYKEKIQKEHKETKIKKYFKIDSMWYLKKYINIKYSFDRGIEFMQIALEENRTEEEKTRALDYIIDIIKIDVQTDIISDIIYKDNDESEKFVLFPENYYDEKGNKQSRQAEKEANKEIDFEKDFIISIPWKKERIFEPIRNINKYGFRYRKKKHYAEYYTKVDIGIVTNGGNHSIAVGIHNRKGKIKANEIDITPMFEHVYSDGINWYNTHTKEIIEPVQDFRIALIYEITKEKIKIESNKGIKYKNMNYPKEDSQEDNIANIDKELDKDSTYYGILTEEYQKGFVKGAEMGEMRGEYIGKIKGKIEMRIKYKEPKEKIKREIIEETHIDEETYDKLYTEIYDKIKPETI